MNKKQTHHIKGNLTSRKKQYNFPGQLIIDGDIEPGCQVSAETIAAQNIYQADIRVRSSVCAHEQISGASIVSAGGVEANSVANSTIRTDQDIRIHEKVLNSHIYTNACCMIPEGLIESTYVMASRCIMAKNIMSSEESPCLLIIGLLCPDDQDQKLQATYLQLEAQKKQLHEGIKQAEKTIAEVLQLKEKIRDMKPGLKKKLKHLREIKDYEAIKALDPFFKELNQRVETAFENYQAAIEDKKKFNREIETFDQEQLDRTKKEYLLRKKDRAERSIFLHSDDTPCIQVSETISKHTRIQGLHSYKRLDSNMDAVQVEEKVVDSSEQTSGILHYEISFSSLT